MTLGQRVFATAVLLLAVSGTVAQADLISTEAADNATVQPGGPRSGSSGKAFFNIEGSANGTFASYGVADFNFGVLPDPVIGVSSARLLLTQSNAAFSLTGDVTIALDTRATPVDIQPGGTSPLRFDGVDPGTATDVSDGDLILLSFAGPFTYTVAANGTVDSYVLVLTPPSAAQIINRLNAAGPIRIVVGTGAANVAATWAGNTNATFAGPTLELEVQFDPGVPAVASSWGKIKSQYR